MCYAHKTFLLCKLYITQGVGVRLHLQSQLIFKVRLAFPHIVVFFRHSGQVILAPPCYDVMLCHCFLVGLSPPLTRLFPPQ